MKTRTSEDKDLEEEREKICSIPLFFDDSIFHCLKLYILLLILHISLLDQFLHFYNLIHKKSNVLIEENERTIRIWTHPIPFFRFSALSFFLFCHTANSSFFKCISSQRKTRKKRYIDRAWTPLKKISKETEMRWCFCNITKKRKMSTWILYPSIFCTKVRFSRRWTSISACNISISLRKLSTLIRFFMSKKNSFTRKVEARKIRFKNSTKRAGKENKKDIFRSLKGRNVRTNLLTSLKGKRTEENLKHHHVTQIFRALEKIRSLDVAHVLSLALERFLPREGRFAHADHHLKDVFVYTMELRQQQQKICSSKITT